MIIEQASGEPYRQYVATHLFEPRGLEGSSYCDEGPIIPGRAEGYVAWRGELRNDEYLSMNQPGAAGALCSTVFDLLAWAEDLRSGEVVSAESYQAMTTPGVLNDGSATTYGFGLAVNDLSGHPSIAHGGGINGFSSLLAYYPEADLDVVVLVNTEGQAGRLAQTIAKWALGVDVSEIRNLRLPEEQLAAYVGTYQLAPDVEVQVSVRAKRLFAKTTGQRTTRLRAQGNHIFVPSFDDQVRMVFIVVDGRATGLVLIEDGGERHAPRVR